MAHQSPQLQKFVTPKGVTIFPSLNTPDEFMNKVQYKCDLLFDADDPAWLEWSTAFKAAAEAHFEVAKANTKSASKKKQMFLHVPWKDHEDADGNPTGQVRLKVTCGGDYKPKMYDASGSEIDAEVWSGSVLKATGKAVPFGPMGDGRTGIALSRLDAVKIYELRTGSGDTDWGDAPEDSPEVPQVIPAGCIGGDF